MLINLHANSEIPHSARMPCPSPVPKDGSVQLIVLCAFARQQQDSVLMSVWQCALLDCTPAKQPVSCVSALLIRMIGQMIQHD